MEITVLISTRPLESIFFNTLVDKFLSNLSDFNKVQLEILISKHCRNYCLLIGLEVCRYQHGVSIYPTSSQDRLPEIQNAEIYFKNDLSIFLKRFLSWDDSNITEFLEWFRNILMNVFVKTILDVTGVDIYDTRKYTLKQFRHDHESSTSADRVLSLTFEAKNVSTL